MYEKEQNGLHRYSDLIFLDILVMYLSYIAVYLTLRHDFHFAETQFSRFTLVFYLAANLICVFLTENYKNFLIRGYFQEFKISFLHCGLITLMVIAALYAMKTGHQVSRLQIGGTFVVYSLLTFAVRALIKFKRRNDRQGKNAISVLLICPSDAVKNVVADILEYKYSDKKISGICVSDQNRIGEEIAGIPVVASRDTVVEYACQHWVDEVLFSMENVDIEIDELHSSFLRMGIAVHDVLFKDDDSYGCNNLIETIGPYSVLTRSSRLVTDTDRLVKRAMDIVGSVIGLLLTVPVFLIIAPIIYIQSPGPIFFRQERIGKNGRHFRMYKFRSMTLNAEKLKSQYAAVNRIDDGMMFKLDWDPRIIGNREENGVRKTGIGEFIRKTSIDEMPQFFNVLKGDMSLVGTRPPTLDEWEKYDVRHRIRMAVKPGITGMWQVSGRSSITDFDEVVRLDREYIEKWSIGLDIRILLKTVAVVFKGKGAF